MAKTSAERKKTYIEKLKATGKYDEFKKKKAADEKCRQHKMKKGLQQLPKAVREKTKRLNREYNKRKAAAYRQRQKEKTNLSEQETIPSQPDAPANPSEEGPYKTTSALDKAVAKFRRGLPSASDKKEAVVKKFVRSVDTKVLQEIVVQSTNPNNPKRTRGLKSDVIESIIAFYERDDISRISPNMRDCKKIKDPLTGEKEMKQTRYLMHKLSDVHKMFLQFTKKDNGDDSELVQLSKFCSLRPIHVKLVNCTPMDQCLCYYHTNFIMCCKALHRYVPEFPVYGGSLEYLLLCESPTKDCWFRDCVHCVNAKKAVDEIMTSSGKDLKVVVEWCQWKKNKESNRFEKCTEKGTLAALTTRFLDILPEFLKHSYIKRSQSIQFQKDSEEVSESNGEVATLQIDFAESFNCEHQDEIQSAHWNQATVSLFTACLKCAEEIFPKALSSDDTSHTKYEIACYMFKIISNIPSSVKTLKIWSDGPNNQFKNRYMAALIKLFHTTCNIKIFWNFFATAHGKGSVDGIGAVVKNRVRRLVKSRQAIVNNSSDFCEAFNSEDSVIEVTHMTENETAKIRKDLQLDNVFATAPPLANVFSFHQIQFIDQKIKGFVTSQEGYDYFKKCHK